MWRLGRYGVIGRGRGGRGRGIGRGRGGMGRVEEGGYWEGIGGGLWKDLAVQYLTPSEQYGW